MATLSSALEDFQRSISMPSNETKTLSGFHVRKFLVPFYSIVIVVGKQKSTKRNFQHAKLHREGIRVFIKLITTVARVPDRFPFEYSKRSRALFIR